jgi:adenylate cyclase
MRIRLGGGSHLQKSFFFLTAILFSVPTRVLASIARPPRQPERRMRYLFEDYALDTDRRELCRRGEVVRIEPQAFDLLEYLIQNRGRLVSRDDLIASVWAGRIVSDSAMTTRINAARCAIDDSGKAQRLIKTVPRKGIRFVGPVQEEEAGGAEAGARSSTPYLALPDKPSIAVLPFTDMSGEPGQAYFSDGITEDIITELSRFSELFVIARNSSFRFKGSAPDIRQVGRELGVRYVLVGSIRRAGDRVRISAQLIDAVSGAQLWGERYDRELTDVFAVQDEVCRAIVSILMAHVNKAEAERTLLKPPTTWQAHDFLMRASDVWSARNADDPHEARHALHEARRLLERSISLDPNYARAYAMLSQTHLVAWIQPLDEDHLNPAALERAHCLARKSLQLGPDLSIAHAQLGRVLTFEGQHEQAIAEFEKAVALNPNFTDWWFGMALQRAGEPARAITVIETHMRYDPFCPPTALGHLGLAHYTLKEYSKALPPLRELTLRVPNMRHGHVWLAATLAQLGQLDEAHAEAAEILRIDPKYTIDGTQRQMALFKRTEDVERFLDGLRKAGLPEK